MELSELNYYYGVVNLKINCLPISQEIIGSRKSSVPTHRSLEVRIRDIWKSMVMKYEKVDMHLSSVITKYGEAWPIGKLISKIEFIFTNLWSIRNKKWKKQPTKELFSKYLRISLYFYGYRKLAFNALCWKPVFDQTTFSSG